MLRVMLGGLALAVVVGCGGDDASGTAANGGAGNGGTGAGATGGTGGAGGTAPGGGGAGGTSGTGATSGSGGTGGSGGTSGAGGTAPCEPIPGASFGSSPTVGPVTDRPPPEHPDLNFELVGWTDTGGMLGLVDIAGPTDALAPKLHTLFGPDRVPDIGKNHRMNGWDWGQMKPTGPLTDWDVTLIGMVTTPGEILELPDSGYDIGGNHDARLLFADEDSITLKYTGEDNVVYGYTIHIKGVCLDPALTALYQANDAAGRSELPALTGNQPFARARGTELLVAIRDTGAYMDPRSKKDWW